VPHAKGEGGFWIHVQVPVGFMSTGGVFLSLSLGIGPPPSILAWFVMLGWLVAVIGFVVDRVTAPYVPKPAPVPIRTLLKGIRIRDLGFAVWTWLMLMILMLLSAIIGGA